LVYDFRKVACASVTLQGLSLGPLEANSRGARIRTLSASFGGSLLSQEHTPVHNDGARGPAPTQTVASAGPCATKRLQLSTPAP
jgi:hypothetical protein